MDPANQEKMNQLSAQLRKTTTWLSDSEKKVRTLVKVLPVGLFITDEGGMIEAVNPKGISLFKTSTESMVGQNIRRFFEPSADGSAMGSIPDKLEETDEPLGLVALQAGGGKFPCELQVCPFSTSGVMQFLVLVDDVTQRHELERMKKEFVAMVSHDLRTPLTSIQTFLSLLGDGLYDESIVPVRQRAVSMGEEAVRLITMINSLLDLDRLEAGRLEMFFDIVTCKSICQRSIQSIKPLAEKRGVALQLSLPPGGANVLADSDYIVQVLINLLSNAVKFSPTAGKVTLQVVTTEERVKFQVIDEGPGITEDFRTRMFNRFAQASSDDARVKGGSGLGLSIAKSIVEQHGGLIGVESQEGKGSSFWFTIPRVIT